jgi:membrane protein required for colicin V production
MPINGLDIAFFVIVFFFFVRGIFRGFLKEVVSIAGLGVGFIVARSYYPLVADALQPFVQNASFRMALGFMILFLAVSLLISLLGLILDKLITVSVGNVTNGLLGAVVGTAKAIILTAVLLMVVTAFIRPDTPFFKESLVWPYLKFISNSVKEFVSPDLKEALDKKSKLLPGKLPEELKERLPDLPDIEGTTAPPWKPAVPSKDAAKETDDQTIQPAPAWPGSKNR